MPRRHTQPSPLLSPPLLIILIPAIILLFLIYALPPILSATSQILQPTVSVKKSWDSLNVFLVIFAILCGVFARKNDDVLPDPPDHAHVHTHIASDPLRGSGINNTDTISVESESLQLPQQQWFGYSESPAAKIYHAPVRTPESGGGGRLTRRSSYPDLRQVESLWETRDDVDNHSKSQFRFFDDFEINNYRSVHGHHARSGSDEVKEIPVDTYVLHSSPPPPKSETPRSPAPPAPPPPPPRQHKPKRTYETVKRKEKKVEKTEEVKIEEAQSTPPPPPPPPRPVAPPSPMWVRSEHKHGRSDQKRKSNVKKEIAMVWASVLSNQRKRKRKQKVTRVIYETATPDPPPEQSQRPPPPPPPPPSSVFQSFFKKSSKAKKDHSVTTAPPPPPPLPPTVSGHSRSTKPPPIPEPAPPRPPPSGHSRRRPPLPTKPNNLYNDNVILNSGSQSPLIPIPPPPPPFKLPELNFLVRGDFVKIRSAQSSRCASPEREEVDDEALPAGKEEPKSTIVNVMDGGDGAGRGSPSVFCPSPDVNTKADNFIARLKDEWRLEKMNSYREEEDAMNS